MGLTRSEYASVYGPTTGDRIRLADTNLLATVEADDNRPGSEPLVGMGKTVREGQLIAGDVSLDEALDVCITNVVLLDPLLGVRKTSIGIRDGRVTAVGRAGDPGVDPDVTVPISAATGVVPGEGLIATPGTLRHARPPARSPARAGGVGGGDDHGCRDELLRGVRPRDQSARQPGRAAGGLVGASR